MYTYKIHRTRQREEAKFDAYTYIFGGDCMPGGGLSPQRRELNLLASGLRIAAEWGFAYVHANFQWYRAASKQKLGELPLRNVWLAGVILANAFAILKPNQTSKYFDVEPPTLEEYFN
ncbi:hypothetical protein RI054_29g117240 [Pseudoscourfieldia marina]